MISVLYDYKLLTFYFVAIIIFIGLFKVLYYYIRYGSPNSGNKKWESQRAYRDFYVSLAWIFEGVIVITSLTLTNFLYDKNLNFFEIIIPMVLSYSALPLVGLFIGEYFRAKKFHLAFKYVFLNGPKK